MRVQINWTVLGFRNPFASIACLSLFAMASCQTIPSELEGVSLAHPRPDWEAMFRAGNPSWRGSDASYSVPLDEGRVLWLFGDTWITKPDAVSRESGELIRNTIGIQRRTAGGDWAISYHWGTDPNADTPLHAAPFFALQDDGTWLWPLDGVRVGSELVLFMSRLEEGGELGFTGVDNHVLVVENPDASPEQWITTEWPNPFYESTDKGQTIFGLAVEAYGDYVYVYGIRERWSGAPDGHTIIVARVPPHALVTGRFAEWRFFDGRKWTQRVEDADSLFDEAAAEMSVHFDAPSGLFVAVYSEMGWSDKILARFAESPEGPWSRTVTIYHCPDVKRNTRYFCYAAKAHPEFALPSGELLVTYAANSMEFEDHVNDDVLYWPRCVSVDLDLVLTVLGKF